MSAPLSPERLAEIAERAAHLYEYALQTDEGDTLAGDDVPALLAEIARLKARVAELERPAADGPRCYHGDVIGSGDCPGCDNEAATFREGWQR